MTLQNGCEGCDHYKLSLGFDGFQYESCKKKAVIFCTPPGSPKMNILKRCDFHITSK